MSIAKACALVGNDNVAKQRQRCPQAHGIAIDRPNDRLLHLQHVLNQALGAPEGDAQDAFAHPAVIVDMRPSGEGRELCIRSIACSPCALMSQYDTDHMHL